PIENSRITFFENHHAAALDSLVIRIDCSRHEVGESDIGNEAPALLHLQQGLLARLPLGNAHLTVEHARIDAYIWNRLGQAKCPSQRLAILSRFGRSRQPHVMLLLFRSSALMDGGQRETPRQARS